MELWFRSPALWTLMVALPAAAALVIVQLIAPDRWGVAFFGWVGAVFGVWLIQLLRAGRWRPDETS